MKTCSKWVDHEGPCHYVGEEDPPVYDTAGPSVAAQIRSAAAATAYTSIDWGTNTAFFAKPIDAQAFASLLSSIPGVDTQCFFQETTPYVVWAEVGERTTPQYGGVINGGRDPFEPGAW